MPDLLLNDLVRSLARVEVVKGVHPGSREATTRKLPDIVGWADLLHDEETTFASVVDRASGGYPVRPHVLEYPKDVGGSRFLTMLDPLDEVAFRALAGRLLQESDPLLGPEVVTSRMAVAPPAWAFKDFRYVLDTRRRRAERLVTERGFRSMVVFDVADYFARVATEVGRSSLLRLGAPMHVLEPVVCWLELLNGLYGRPGLPIGPEASAVVGTAVLHPVDEALRSRGLSFIRYMDDIFVFHREAQSELSSMNCVEEALSGLGLSINSTKLETHGASSSIAHFAPYAEFLNGLPREVLGDVLRFQLGVDPVDRSKVRQLLRRATRQPMPGYSLLLEEHPELVDVAPREAGDLLISICREQRRTIDQDFIVECCVSSNLVTSSAGRLHALRAARQLRLSKACGQAMWKFVEAGESVPLCAYAADSWSHSDDAKPGQATELAEATGDPHLRRALAVSVRRTSDGPKRHRCLGKFKTLGPECRPAAKWIEEDPNACRVF